VDVSEKHYRLVAMGMEPKPPQGRRLPIWIGGRSEAAYRRVARLGDGWLAGGMPDAETTHRALASIRRHAEAAHRDPDAIGLQSMVATPPKDPEGKRFYAEHDRVAARVAELRAMGFQGAALNATAIFQAGARSVVGDGGAAVVRTGLRNANDREKDALSVVIGSVLLLLGATTVFMQLQDALNRIWKVDVSSHESAVRVFVKERLLSLAMVLGI